MPFATLASASVAAAAASGAQESVGGGVVGWAAGLMEALGGPGAGLIVALENLFPPLPSELFLPLAGFTAGRGGMSLASALVWTTVGSVVGALVLYWTGALLGPERTRALAARIPLLRAEDIDRNTEWFDRHGSKAVFFGRMVPVFRSFISVPAGIGRMRMPVFLLYTTLGSAVWNTTLVLAGYFLGEQWTLVEQYVGVFSKVVLAAVAVAVVVWGVRRGRSLRRARAARERQEERREERREGRPEHGGDRERERSGGRGD
ncbi:hypothetical protein GCM10010406_13890 [Streptomyces thermolineatus]|uniref:VTT domain-containing protein n=1 Tax=Streptomyces thermolineatus TaxID=44033 RepID=A0ABN3L719_9ACTN